MDEAMGNRYAPITNAMNENKKTANFQSFNVIAIARKVLRMLIFHLEIEVHFYCCKALLHHKGNGVLPNFQNPILKWELLW